MTDLGLIIEKERALGVSWQIKTLIVFARSPL